MKSGSGGAVAVAAAAMAMAMTAAVVVGYPSDHVQDRCGSMGYC